MKHRDSRLRWYSTETIEQTIEQTWLCLLLSRVSLTHCFFNASITGPPPSLVWWTQGSLSRSSFLSTLSSSQEQGQSISQILKTTGSMSNDAGFIEHITVPSLSSASFASKRCTGSILIISTSTSSIAGMVLWNASEALSNKITSKNMKRVTSPWNRRNYDLIAKHLVWTDYMRSQKQTQVHEDEHNILVPGRSRQEEGPLRHVRNRGNLLGIVLRLQSQSNKLEGA